MIQVCPPKESLHGITTCQNIPIVEIGDEVLLAFDGPNRYYEESYRKPFQFVPLESTQKQANAKPDRPSATSGPML